MGSSGHGSSFEFNTSRGTSHSETRESALSMEQLKILQNREAQWNNYFFPELQKSIASSDVNTKEGAAQLADAANQINASYGASERQINQNLAQQNLLGQGNGVQTALNAANARAKSSALAQAYYNTLSNMSAQKTQLLGLGAGLMATPTQSAAYHETQNQQNTSFGFGNTSNKNTSVM